jgi:O-antigen ligase
VLVGGDLVTTRPLVSTQALILGLIGLAIVLRSKRAFPRLLAVGFVVLAVLCQHRSVWAALVLAIASLLLFAPSKLRLRLVGLGLLTGFVVLVLYDAGTLNPVITKFDAAYHNRGTLIDRELAWHTLVSQQNHMGTTAVLTGQPFGTGYVRLEPGGKIETFAPHNYYVSMYLRVGLIGVAALVLALLRGVWRNIRFRQPVGVVWGIALITYCYAYNIQYYVAPILAVSLGVRAAVSSRADDEAPALEAEPAALVTAS